MPANKTSPPSAAIMARIIVAMLPYEESNRWLEIKTAPLNYRNTIFVLVIFLHKFNIETNFLVVNRMENFCKYICNQYYAFVFVCSGSLLK